MRRIGLDTDRPPARPGRVTAWLSALTIVLAIGLFGVGGVSILDSRSDAWHRVSGESDHVVRLLTREIARTLTVQDLSLQRVAAAQFSSGTDRSTILAAIAAKNEGIGSLIIVNPKGDVIAPSSFRSNVSEQSYFRAHQDRPDAGLFVGQPFRNPMRNGELSIALSRRLNNPDGTFNGVAANILPLTLFSDIFGDLDLTHSESTTLVRSDGKVIVRFPFREGDTARDLAKTPLFENYSAVEAGNLVSIGSPGDVDRLYTFRHLPNLPVILSVGVAVREIETEWLQKALVQGAVLLLLCAATIVLCLRLRRENRGRMDAEAKLRGAAVQMAMTPVTDGLTGLANRKSFEERMTREWSRSIRAGTPIALVLLDPDLFKRYNDDYGHNEGDQVLRAIAGCIAASAMRPSDTNARVGGEEFAVLLPETDLTGASVVAERIRAAVAALAIPFEANPAGHLTISAGVTIARPAVGDPRASLIVRAAAALDAAKDAGRNIVGRADADGVISVGEQPLFRQVANEQQAL